MGFPRVRGRLAPLDKEKSRVNRERIRKRKTHELEEYDGLLRRYSDFAICVTQSEYASRESTDNKTYLLVRHDVDHDIDGAVNMAKWEAKRGIRSTYCLLHDAWYYGELVDGKYAHSKELLRSARKIQDLGHEINLHNNLVSLSLREGCEPSSILELELEFFRRYGIDVTGTSSHGDRLCRELNYRNYELFRGCEDVGRGGARTVSYSGNAVALGVLEMGRFGLSYESYQWRYDEYTSDAGGVIATREQCHGNNEAAARDGMLIGILTHPIWWNV